MLENKKILHLLQIIKCIELFMIILILILIMEKKIFKSIKNNKSLEKKIIKIM